MMLLFTLLSGKWVVRMARTKQTARAHRTQIIVFDPSGGKYHYSLERLAVHYGNAGHAVAELLFLSIYMALELQHNPDDGAPLIDSWVVYDQRTSLMTAPVGLVRNKGAEDVLEKLGIPLKGLPNVGSCLFGKVVLMNRSRSVSEEIIEQIEDIIGAMDASLESLSDNSSSPSSPFPHSNSSESDHSRHGKHPRGKSIPLKRKRSTESENELKLDEPLAKQAHVDTGAELPSFEQQQPV